MSPPPPIGRQDRVAFRPGGEDLQANGALPGDHVWIVVGPHVDRRSQVVATPRLRLGVVAVTPGDLDGDGIGLERAEPFQLGWRDGGANQDRDPHPVAPRREGHRDPVVAGGGGDERQVGAVPVVAGGGQQRHPVVCPACLEAAGRLQRLELEPDLLRAGGGSECRCGIQGGLQRDAAEPGGGRKDVCRGGEAWRHALSVSGPEPRECAWRKVWRGGPDPEGRDPHKSIRRRREPRLPDRGRRLAPMHPGTSGTDARCASAGPAGPRPVPARPVSPSDGG